MSNARPSRRAPAVAGALLRMRLTVLIALRENLILRRPRSGRLEGRRASSQRRFLINSHLYRPPTVDASGMPAVRKSSNRLAQPGAGVEPAGVVPEQLALALFGHVDALEIVAAGDVVARPPQQLGQRRLDRLGMLVEPLDPEWQPAMPGFKGRDPQARIAVHHAAADQGG